MNTILSNSSHLTEYRSGFGVEKIVCDMCGVEHYAEQIQKFEGYDMCENCFMEYEPSEETVNKLLK